MATFSADPVFLLWSREGSDTRPGAWYEPQHFVHLHSVKTDRFHKSDEKGKDEPTTRSFNGNCGNNNVTGKKKKKRKKVMKASIRPVRGGV